MSRGFDWILMVVVEEALQSEDEGQGLEEL